MNKTDALIIGAGPTGLFTAHQLNLIGLNCEVVDNLDKIGGQCIELCPDKAQCIDHQSYLNYQLPHSLIQSNLIDAQ